MRGERAWPILDEESWSGRSVADRARGIEAACRMAMQLLEDASTRRERLTRIDPVPASTREHLRRLAADG